MAFNPLPSDLAFVWDAVAMLISLLAVMSVVQINSIIQKKNILSTIVTRKLVHMFVAPVFLVSWLLFSGEWHSPYFAAVVPIIFVVMFYAIGTGKLKNEAFVVSMSRSGEARELLFGTLFYAVIIVLTALLWFYNPSPGAAVIPTGLVVIGCLAGGDGLADVIGRKFGKHQYTFRGSVKSVEGSLGMLLGSFVFSFILLAIFNVAGAGMDLVPLIAPLLLVSAVAAVVEGLSPKNVDNWTITIAAVAMLALLHLIDPGFWPFAIIGGV